MHAQVAHMDFASIWSVKGESIPKEYMVDHSDNTDKRQCIQLSDGFG